MENTAGGGMRINWVVADSTVLPPDVDVSALKDIAAIWGGWRTWRGCSTDNVICNDVTKAYELLKRKLNEQCNMYIPSSMYTQLDRPKNVQLYQGQFTFEIDNKDELISIQLVSGQSDIVLLLGFDWTEKSSSSDPLTEHRAKNYRRFVKDTIESNPTVQWVLIDHPDAVAPELAVFENLTQDSLENVTELLRPQ
jgi:hypothetical protein